MRMRRRVELIVGKPIYPRDVPDMEGLSIPKQVVRMSGYTREVMQGMMDAYYSARNIDTKESAI